MLMNYIAKFLAVHVQTINEKSAADDWFWSNHQGQWTFTETILLWFDLNDPVTIMIFDTDHKLPTYLQNVILILTFLI